MPQDRAPYRNVHFYDTSAATCVGGFYQNGSITEENLIWILSEVLLITDGEHPWTIQHRPSGRTITPSSNPVVLGNYDIYSTGPLQVTDEPWFARITSHSVSGREDQFRYGVCARDGKCVISGQVNPWAQWNNWAGFEAVHVFPVGKESLWNEFNYGRWITNMDDAVGVSRIHSVQNGLLMTRSLHTLFDQYLFSINPDDGYKIVEFGPGSWGIDGRILDPVCRDPNTNNCVSDELLQWHFRQTVLANMRGAGEPIFESDFPPGSDMMATLRDEPYGKERFEMILDSKLQSEITNK
ncbi:hypothetical protein I7I53_04824 [Histoplasma capsulatum var. duboisii H88]|uniref:HNH nuclease domain-containing protein n=1 Tax=Ajellomyces capsulatus (strain H88) TaxID=544711 RepID=A0A8A1LWP2_AJEC8|nr:hypothetical protein I7I53_04824 [Histoplasma capsulatum var. duboisii H88]